MSARTASDKPAGAALVHLGVRQDDPHTDGGVA